MRVPFCDKHSEGRQLFVPAMPVALQSPEESLHLFEELLTLQDVNI